ncbi:septation ring formation regulator EzrA [Virgibacillus natechei]|uniref:Septation ring formation regulator EzrA n=1 Tax=Virgibacillus natechei TaxID=1216297 RepID=A0ABS4IIS3_9BACI|nr:hypothetical protein [Virgibacillus natechei]MBP1970832.1 septation ring formation regulator EzrA [Virgibacillus natechei]UZD12276.1 hypothetical protein OLD84_15305 [Virgibacillus natechei]
MTQDELNHIDKRFDRLEGMIGQLINTVDTIMEEQTSMKSDITSVKDEQATMKSDLTSMKDEQATMKSESETRHAEVMELLNAYKADNDLLWDRTTKNEREIGIVKKLYGF